MADDEQQAGQSSPAPDAWGSVPSAERQRELEDLFVRQQQWVESTPEPRDVAQSMFRNVRLNGADVFWLAARPLLAERDPNAVPQEIERLYHAQEDIEIRIRLRFDDLHLEGVDLHETHLERSILDGAHMEKAQLGGAHLELASLTWAHLQGADLFQAHLEGASLQSANAEGAGIQAAYLQNALVMGAHLEGTNLRHAHLEGADLVRATFDGNTDLRFAHLYETSVHLGLLLARLRSRPIYRDALLGDIKWNGVDLTVIDWSGLRKLGDETLVPWWRRSRVWVETATRANIQLSKQLDNAGLKDDSDRFAYRAQVCQRDVHLRRLHLGRWFFSWLLYIVAGYGYRPLRTLFWYLAVIVGFAFAYAQATHGLLTFGLPPSQVQPLAWYEALVLSVSSFHGRGFFQPVQSLGDPVAILAAIEAVFGLFIEISFIATFTQRYFGK